MSVFTLYQYPGGDGLSSLSPPCIKIEFALRLSGAEHRVETVRSPLEARRVSPSGRLPAVHIGEARFTDSITILDEIERRIPGRPPFLNDPGSRTIDRLWEHFFNDSMYWLGFALRWSDRESREDFFRAVFGRMPAPARTAARWIMMTRMARRAAGQGSGLKSRDQIDREIARCLEMLEESLAAGKFLQGRDAPGRGDLAAASLLAQMGFRKTMPRWERRILDSGRITEYLHDVYDACGMRLPRWLDPARSEPASRGSSS